MTELCHCGSCEQAIERALGIANKMLLDNECSQFILAVGIVLSVAGRNITRGQIAAMPNVKDLPKLLRDVIVTDAAVQNHAVIEEKLREVWGQNESRYTEILNEGIDAANKKHTDEQGLPKGD